MKWLCRVVLIAVALMTCSHGTRACKPLSERMAEGVSLVGVVDVTHLSTSGMNLYIEVDNDTCHRFVVSRAEIDVVEDGENVVTISLRDKVVVRGRRTSKVLIPLRFNARSSFALHRTLRRALEAENGITLNYRIRGGTSLFRRNTEAEGVAITELLANAPIAAAALEGLEQYLNR